MVSVHIKNSQIAANSFPWKSHEAGGGGGEGEGASVEMRKWEKEAIVVTKDPDIINSLETIVVTKDPECIINSLLP